MILHRTLQIVGVLALLMCADLAWNASPWSEAGQWVRSRLLYAAAGAVSALALIAIGGLGVALKRAEARAEAMAASLARIEEALRRELGPR